MAVKLRQHEQLIEENCSRLLSRASAARGVSLADLLPRVCSVLQKTFKTAPEEIEYSDAKNLIDALHIDDLCLVLACERGDEAAWQYLFTNFGSTVKAAARKITSNTDDAEDLANSIWAELHGLRRNENGRPSGKIVYYSGRGSLAGWLRAVVAQLAIDAHRKQSRLVQVEEDREFEIIAHEAAAKDVGKLHLATENPEKVLGEKRVRLAIETALTRAIGELDAEDRLLVKLYYLDDMNLKQAAAILGFHEATASRRVVKIQTNLRRRIEEILARDDGWHADEIKHNLANASSILETDVEKMLKD